MAVAYKKAAIKAAARDIRPHLDELLGPQAGRVRARIDRLLASRAPWAARRLLALLRGYPPVCEWLLVRLGVPRSGWLRQMRVYLGLVEDDYQYEDGYDSYESYEEFDRYHGAERLWEDSYPAGLPSANDKGDGAARFFRAELEDLAELWPLVPDEQYTLAFSVGLDDGGGYFASRFPDEILAAADPAIEVFELTVQVDSDDFDLLSDRTRPLRVPRTGRSRGKARFDVAPRHDGECRLTASVHYKGNFVHQMELTCPVGQTARPVLVSARGRPPDSAAGLEPRDISILLEPAPGAGFTCTALGSVAGQVTLPITAAELADAVKAVRAAMVSVVDTYGPGGYVFQSGIDIPRDVQETALRTLARAGARLFQQLFLHHAAGADARRVGEWLQRYATDPALRLTVQVFAYRAPLPWAMLYLGEVSEGAVLDWNNFLGMRHVIEQLPLQPGLGTVDNQIASAPELTVSVNVNTAIDDPAQGLTLVAAHQQHWRDTAAARSGLSLLTRSTRTEVVRALAAGAGDQVVYFCCHATSGGQDNGDPDAAAIIMAEDDAATVRDLNLDAPATTQLPGSPLVFINACESAGLSPLFYSGFVPYFMAKGARGVIGTECQTPTVFAVEWASAFFDRFLDGAPVGDIVLALRQDFLHAHGNPLGLVYAVYCDADTRVAPALARTGPG